VFFVTKDAVLDPNLKRPESLPTDVRRRLLDVFRTEGRLSGVAIILDLEHPATNVCSVGVQELFDVEAINRYPSLEAEPS
jgi:hypothetical protein